MLVENFWRNISGPSLTVHLNVLILNCIERKPPLSGWIRALLKERSFFSEKVEFVRGVHVTLGWVEIEWRVKVQPLHFEPGLRPRVQWEGHSGSVTGACCRSHLQEGKTQPDCHCWYYRCTAVQNQPYSSRFPCIVQRLMTAADMTAMWWTRSNRVQGQSCTASTSSKKYFQSDCDLLTNRTSCCSSCAVLAK